MMSYSCVVLFRNHKIENYDEFKTQLSALELEPLFLNGEEIDGWYNRSDLQLEQVLFIVTDDNQDKLKLYQEKCPSASFAWLHEPVKDFESKQIRVFADEMDILHLLTTTASTGTKDDFMKTVLENRKLKRKQKESAQPPHDKTGSQMKGSHTTNKENEKDQTNKNKNNQKKKTKTDNAGSDKERDQTKDESINEQNNHQQKQLETKKQQSKKPDNSKDTESAESEDTDENLAERTKLLQREVLNRQKWQKNKTIGIWSPIQRTGVSTFTFQFALSLGQKRIQAVALEGITERYIMKEMLERYTRRPKDWTSYAQSVLGLTDQNRFEWIYEDVQFLPLDRKNHQAAWNQGRIEAYVKAANVVDVTLIDLPTGKMEPHTLEMLAHVDEVWVLGNDSIYELNVWTDYIQSIKKDHIPFYFIHNECYPFSNPHEIAKLLKLPLLTTLPAMRDLWMQSYYQKQPLILNSELNQPLMDPFEVLTDHIFAEFEAVPVWRSKKSKQRLWPLLRKTLKHFS